MTARVRDPETDDNPGGGEVTTTRNTVLRGFPRSFPVLLALALVLGLCGMLAHNLMASGGSKPVAYVVPHSAAMEDELGIRFSRVAVVGDGGLVTLTYVVLDSEKATRFQSDVQNPPVLSSDSRPGSAKRVALMKQGHNMRPGSQYYLVYQNPRDLVRHGEKVTIHYGKLTLAHVPVW